jgi:hypothetical protein
MVAPLGISAAVTSEVSAGYSGLYFKTLQVGELGTSPVANSGVGSQKKFVVGDQVPNSTGEPINSSLEGIDIIISS